MNKVAYIILGSLTFILFILLGIWISNKDYLYLPFEYKKSEIIPLERKDFEKPLRLEICYLPSVDSDYECYKTYDSKEIKEFLSLYQDLKYTKYNSLTSWRRTPKRYDIVLRKMTSEDEGFHLFDFYYEDNAEIGYTWLGEFTITNEIIEYLESKEYKLVTP